MKHLILGAVLLAGMVIGAMATTHHWDLGTGFHLKAPDGHCVLVSIKNDNTFDVTTETCE